MRIYGMTKESDGSEVKVSVSIESDALGNRILWFSAPLEFEKYISEENYDAFLVGILYAAMRYGEDISIEGNVSSKLLFNLNNYLVPLLKGYSSECHSIKISARTTTTKRYEGVEVGTGFSGGVDSFCTIYDHYEQENNPEYKISNLLFLNVGAFGGNESTKKIFSDTYKSLSVFPQEIGLRFTPVDSNLYAFHPWGHQKVHTLTSAAGVLFMQAFYKRYYYASTYSFLESYEFHKTLLGKDISILDPIILPLLSTESVELISDGMKYTRNEKVMRIVDYEPVRRFLNVCWSGDKIVDGNRNCSVCGKCCRTQMTLKSLGKLHEFDRVFDIEKYKKAEKLYIIQQMLIQKDNPYAKNNLNLAKEKGIRLPGLFSVAGMRVIHYAYSKIPADKQLKMRTLLFKKLSRK